MLSGLRTNLDIYDAALRDQASSSDTLRRLSARDAQAMRERAAAGLAA